ncbi:MAG: DUF305 domain-containing protein [Bacteroidota bacterium]
MDTHPQNMDKGRSGMDVQPYRRLGIMALLSLLSMYILMYAMVNAFPNVINNLNNFYMAALMAAPMPIFAVLIMRMMYRDGRLNAIIVAVSAVALVVFFLLIRQQAAIGDRQFLRSMIPHHAGAILMCRQAPIQDPEIKALCQSIISSQQSEIDQMKDILERLDR